MSRVASQTTCRKCGAHIRNGLDNDMLGLPARVDDETLTRTGELLAIIAGRKTYSLEGGRLYRRDLCHFKKPADRVYAQHLCWQPMPIDWVQPAAPVAITTDDPPF